MHGLINRSIQCFVRDTYGVDFWLETVRENDIGVEDFEPLRAYRGDITNELIQAVSAGKSQKPGEMLEDLGLYLVNHENCQNIRRLLRFGGDTFSEFLHSLPELHARTRLAVDELDLPVIHLREHSMGEVSLYIADGLPGSGYVLTGVIRALADDYGALAIIDHLGSLGQSETISVKLLDHAFSEGRSFDLSVAQVAAGD